MTGEELTDEELMNLFEAARSLHQVTTASLGGSSMKCDLPNRVLLSILLMLLMVLTNRMS
jgi:hypothetical protein